MNAIDGTQGTKQKEGKKSWKNAGKEQKTWGREKYAKL